MYDAPDMSLIPGPKYELDPLVGKQVRSTYRTTPSVHFGTSKRKDESKDVSEQKSIGLNPKVQSYNSPAFSMAGAPWRHEDNSVEPPTPGPGEVQLPGAMGQQIESKRTNTVTIKMQPHRNGDNNDRSSITKVASPGPGSYDLAKSTLEGRSIRFGTERQRPSNERDTESTPSAASYRIKEDFLSTSKKSNGFKINPAHKFNGRKPNRPISSEGAHQSTEDLLLAELKADLKNLEMKQLALDRQSSTKRILSTEKAVLGGRFGTGPARASWGTGDAFSKSEAPPPTPSPQEYDINQIQAGIKMQSKIKGPGGIKFTNAKARKSDLVNEADPELMDPEKLKAGLKMSRKSTEYNIKFSSVPRFGMRKNKKRVIDGDIVEIVEKDSPGPMDYQMHPALGRQVLSNKRNGIMVLLKGRVKEVKEYGTKPIGPMTYHVPADRGSKASKKMIYNIKFGTAERMVSEKGLGLPGPNRYASPPSAMDAKQHESKYRSVRQITFGAR